MFDHVSLQCDDLAASRRFYETVFASLEISVSIDFGVVIAFSGPDGAPKFWLGETATDSPQREVHLAFAAPDRDTVHAIHAAAQEFGAEVLHEPKEWPQYQPGYYAVFLRDPDGNNVEAVHRVS
ncbi:VOC family protein [Kribbella sp. NBC_01505]|uniref:VOC family protein n=1 Tax=Kribbella sp. NBC_01505 TaxID=2903580 RepID=UPI00386FAEB3